jgi:elongation factor P
MLKLMDLKPGRTVELDGQPFMVTWSQFSKSGRQGGVMKTKLRNLISGTTIEKTFQGSDKTEAADISFRRAQFLYASGDDYEFMVQENFETIKL